MALMAVLESDLRALSSEARRRYPAVKDAAEHAILKLRSLSTPSEIAHNEDVVRIFLMACDVKSIKLSVIGLSCLQKLISHDAVAQSALKEILFTLKDHAEMADDTVQLKTLQTILIIFQSGLHPENEKDMAQALGISLRLLESGRSSDSVHNTAAATFRQAVALVFDKVVLVESLPCSKVASGSLVSRTSSVSDDVSRSISHSIHDEVVDRSLVTDAVSREPMLREGLSRAGKLGLLLLEDLTALAAGGSATWLHIHSLQRTFALDILEFILSNYVTVFQTLVSYQQILRHQICSLLMTSLRTNIELEGESAEPTFRRLVLRSVSHVIRFYSLFLVTESEVFLNVLVNVTRFDLPLWHRILVLEVLRGFCVEARTLRLLFQNFDMDPKNTNVVENMVKALARVVSTIQLVSESSEESLAAVAGMFSSKAKGIEWSMDNDASNAAVLVASEAHAITLAVEGLLGVVFTVATLTDEAVDVGEIESPKYDNEHRAECTGKTTVLCKCMVDSTWMTILDALSLILARSQGEAIILEILKGYQAFTQACGVLRAVEPLNSFLASLCKFTINIPNEGEKRSVLQSPGSRKSEPLIDQRDNVVLTPKNVQALRTLFNVAHRLHNVLGPSWALVLDTLAALDRAIHSPHASTQEVPTSVSRLTRDTSGQYTDFHILSSLNSQLFESSALMHVSAVKSLLSALCQLSSQCILGNSSVTGQASSQHTGSVAFSVERMTSILVNNLHRFESIWDQVIDHLIEVISYANFSLLIILLQLADNPNQQLRNLALGALDQSICAVLGSDQFQGSKTCVHQFPDSEVDGSNTEMGSFECAVLAPLPLIYMSSQNPDVRAGTLKILLHVVERHGEKLYYSWPDILEMLRTVADASEKDLITSGFQSLRVIMNDGISTIPAQYLHVCIEVTGSYSAQKTEINISLTAIGLLWTATDFIAKGLVNKLGEEKSEAEIASGVEFNSKHGDGFEAIKDEKFHSNDNVHYQIPKAAGIDRNKLLFSIFSILQKLGEDERPEVRNSAIRTLFQTLGSHGQKISSSMWEECLRDYVFPILDCVSHLAATSSKDEWQGKELGTRGGKAVHMLIHHSRNTAQKQWDETLVLVLGGITRLLRSFFPFLQRLTNFSAGWDHLLNFIKDSILNGSKEVGLAAISCLQTIVSSHCPKGNLAVQYIKSLLDVYELVLERSPNYKGAAANKVKQEILHGLGDLYVQAKTMFDSDMYLQLLAILQQTIRNSKSTCDMDIEIETVLPVQKAVLEILPLIRPTEHLSSMWSLLLRELLYYLLGSEPHSPGNKEELPSSGNVIELGSHLAVGLQINGGDSSIISKEIRLKPKPSVLGASSISMMKVGPSSPRPGEFSSYDTMTFSCHLFAEKLVPIIVELFLEAPPIEKCNAFPEVICGLGRCMTTRRDNPKGALWRLAVDGFNRILIDDLSRVHEYKKDPNIFKLPRARLWKEVADVYEIFLVGSCGHALSSDPPSAEALKADELIEMTFLNVLGDRVLKGQIDAPIEVLQRLVTTLDRCASRVGSLPLESVGLMPLHCSRFSLSCLQMLFSLCSFTSKESWSPSRTEVSKVSLPILMKRCESILDQFLRDENHLGEHPLPTVRVEETLCVLQELARLVLDYNTASVLPLQPNLKVVGDKDNPGARAHLFLLFPSFCELVVTREPRVRELVQVLLRLVAAELGVQKSSLSI
ncbi:protein MON2 homolog isoform X2 [Asparagus officinalis]|uniref:protein MON2 homolog isoform X2 n=1 Tax=Asparagus officinalis TaxID=4686 RepID=UPI00098E1CEA|nr:protein MON2 homolog isoform X2 [Asparagus officinalis]